MWYQLHPREYARGLRFNAERSEEQVQRHISEAKPWSWMEVERTKRQARRLRAMAILCDRSTAERAGQIDFQGLNSPSLPQEDEEKIVASILGDSE